MLLVRCGYSADEFFAPEDFLSVVNFNTLDTISRLGTGVRDVSEMVLKEIGATVKDLQSMEIKQDSTFAKIKDLRHNEDVNNHEGKDEYGADLHKAGRLSDTRSDASGGGNVHRQVWDAAQNISKKSQERDIHQPDAVGQPEPPPDGNRPDSEGTDRKDNGKAPHREPGAGQSRQSDWLDRTHEQSETIGRGSGIGGAGVQLSIFPAIEQQLEAITQAEDEKSSAFSISQEDIDDVLCKGTGVKDGKLRVYLHFQERQSSKETITFLKNEYGIGGGTLYFTDGTEGHEWHDSKGITIITGRFSEPEAKVLLSWEKVQKHLYELIAVDRYLNDKEKEYLPTYRKHIEEQHQQLTEEENGTLSPAELYKKYLPEIVKKAQENEVYPYLRDRDTLQDNVVHELEVAIEDIVQSMKEDNPAFYEAYSTLPMFREWLVEDVYQRTYQDYITEKRDCVTLHADDPDAPEWVREAAEKKNKPAEKEIAIGMELSIEDRRFVIDSINNERGTVSLRDITFQTGIGFPIFRNESLEFVLRILELQDDKSQNGHKDEPKNEPDNKPIHDKPQSDENSKDAIDLAPVALKQPRVNFRITDDNLGTGGQKTKYNWNVAAIRLIKQLEEQNRPATPEDQEILSRYVGWGGIPQVFDEQNGQWVREYAELKGLLDSDEYASARASTLNAHFTSPTVIKAIYTCLSNMGFQTGNILEPACGVGNFLGLLPDSMKNSRLYGVELDSITGRIAKQLYQNASIAVQGFEETSLPDSFFDLAIGNVPFGSYGVADKKYDKYKFYIHDYFFAKTLDKVRPGGIIAFITSKGTMDKQNPEVRKYIA